MAMAPAHYAVESALRYFFHEWNCGLQPVLNLETLPNGDISINMKINIPATATVQQNGSTSTDRRRTK